MRETPRTSRRDDDLADDETKENLVGWRKGLPPRLRRYGVEFVSLKKPYRCDDLLRSDLGPVC
jgi:hypothetical protein